ncbi:MAG: hypothetical protein JWR19_974 [Pedosphaera sp.]|nr:hypothetical protein [Pedosphaera sp.]
MSRKLQVVILGVVVLVVLCVGVLMHGKSNREALRRFKAELRAKGEKLTFAEFTGPLSTNAEEVASRQIFETNNFSYGG